LSEFSVLVIKIENCDLNKRQFSLFRNQLQFLCSEHSISDQSLASAGFEPTSFKNLCVAGSNPTEVKKNPLPRVDYIFLKGQCAVGKYSVSFQHLNLLCIVDSLISHAAVEAAAARQNNSCIGQR